MSDESKLIGLKVGFIIGILIVTFLAGLVPIKWNSCRKNQTALSLANSFGGGVFLAMAFVHMIPETMETYYKMQYTPDDPVQHEDERLLRELDDMFELLQIEKKEEDYLTLESSSHFGEPEFYQKESSYIQGKDQKEQASFDYQLQNLTQTLTSDDVSDQVEQELDEVFEAFPLPYLLILLGYTLILLLDKVVAQSFHSGHTDALHIHHQRHGEEEIKEGEQKNPKQKNEKLITEDLEKEQIQVVPNTSNIPKGTLNDTKQLQAQEGKEGYGILAQELSEPLKPNEVIDRRASEVCQHEEKSQQFEEEVRSYLSRTEIAARQLSCELQRRLSKDDVEDSSFKGKHRKSEDLTKVGEPGILENCSIMSLALLIALSAHSVFEGLALGLASNFSDAVNFIIALSAHKIPATISLGVSLAKNFDNQKQAILLIGFFSLMTPLGIAIGMAIRNSSDFVDVFFNSLAAGTFVYIGANEIIVEEFSVKGPMNWARLAAFTVGIGLITCLGLIEE